MKSPSDRLIRKAENDDAEALERLQAACFPTELHDSPADVRRCIREELCFVALEGGAVVGAAIGLAFGTGRRELYAVEVLPTHQQRGIGAALVTALLDAAPPETIWSARAVSEGGSHLCASFADRIHVTHLAGRRDARALVGRKEL